MAEIKVPELAESITEGTIAQWLKKPGDYVEKGEYIVELETDKVNVEIISDYAGTLTELKADEGDTVQVGETIAIVSDTAEKPAEKVTEATPVEPKADNEQEEEKKLERPIASPAARKMAREKGIDLNNVPTMDPLGRVRKQDVSSYSEQSAQTPTPKVEKKQVEQEQHVTDPTKPVERIRMSRRRQTIANRLVEVQQTAAMLTTFNEVDMTAIMNIRKRRKEKFFEQHDVRLGFMSFFTKAVVAALKKYPYVNGEIQGEEIVLKKYYDIGIAVAAPNGLVVPVVRDAERKNFAEIESDIMELAEKARTNKLSLNDLQGGTFTITNGGVFGSLLSTPILNGPQVGILGMHKIQLRPVAIDEERMENRPMMYIALSYDHRIIDGKEAVSFLATVKELLEDPETLLLEG
ncbi:2-oxoglutarate dehydrogenase complex dihydrolipoyllysine-residue succinyltransferase [Bacillus aquiflavi]|uniref:Dihydrolipoyllysine-residue succinyltransferase component of 2-oxoglutarate dehydrogenase complex n=1 Tax=Bacillus aquiflavi TaxID=2672567 RepID=A0A6B3W3E9_9BACI|nr:2-oxoglutarate dehydrogenase complex dihydrolipoyllysine-residue succinyltransferase [Bacillus aquiflavi]MBA4537161.1 2-oxoglutarate dehydrogenase complex dihydrolipoyllysine-residue succinyltransferase [Bacillus aquiflavi]NEY82436.1 2-oxoglutarate dehydrogenase complex dihydrolipoyllysine-residue succinyltransferase [Bacillus aquiflavi]